jgi:hypothetical protein
VKSRGGEVTNHQGFPSREVNEKEKKFSIFIV